MSVNATSKDASSEYVHRQRLISKELAGNPFHEYDRQEYTDRRHRCSHDRPAHLAGAAPRRLHGTGATVAAALHTLEDDNRIVDEHTDPQSQPAQGHDVQADVEGEHHEERGDHRKRYRQRDDEGAFEGTQKKKRISTARKPPMMAVSSTWSTAC